MASAGLRIFSWLQPGLFCHKTLESPRLSLRDTIRIWRIASRTTVARDATHRRLCVFSNRGSMCSPVAMPKQPDRSCLSRNSPLPKQLEPKQPAPKQPPTQPESQQPETKRFGRNSPSQRLEHQNAAGGSSRNCYRDEISREACFVALLRVACSC